MALREVLVDWHDGKGMDTTTEIETEAEPEVTALPDVTLAGVTYRAQVCHYPGNAPTTVLLTGPRGGLYCLLPCTENDGVCDVIEVHSRRFVNDRRALTRGVPVLAVWIGDVVEEWRPMHVDITEG